MNSFTKFNELQNAVIKFTGLKKIEDAKIRYTHLTENGIEIDKKELDNIIFSSSGMYEVLPNGSIIKILLHIVEVDAWTQDRFDNMVSDISERRKYHIFPCKTIEQMKNKGKFSRYKKASNIDGKFHYIINFNNERLEFKDDNRIKLAICKNCKRNFIETFNEKFDLKNFIKANFTQSLSVISEYDYDSIPNKYSFDWRYIATREKESKNWTCQQCLLDCSDKKLKKFLHAHHKNSNKADNCLANIEILCIKCHSEQFNHEHIKNSPAYKEFIKINKLSSS